MSNIEQSGDTTFVDAEERKHDSGTKHKHINWRDAKEPNRSDSTNCSDSRRGLAQPRRCSCGRGHSGRQGLPGGVCVDRSGSAGLACRRVRHSNRPPNLRSSISRKALDSSRSSSKKQPLSAPKSSSCNGLRMVDARFEKLCASNGISVLLTQSARSINIRLRSRPSPLLNWSLCLTSVEERLAPRSRVCACLDRPLPAAKLMSGLSGLDQRSHAFQAYALLGEQMNRRNKASGVTKYEPYQ
jgi:hypothetical protein